MSSNNKKKMIFSSLFVILICTLALVGVSYAWFTDTASTGVETITTGNLNVKVMYSTDMLSWKEATEKTQLFDDDALWEPGHTEVVYLKVVNSGSLAFKFETDFASDYNSSKGKSVLGNYYYIGDYIKVGSTYTNVSFMTREDAIASIADNEKDLKKGVQITEGWTTLKAGEETDPLAIVIYMPTTVGNEANPKSKSWTSKITGIGLKVRATQANVESDSYDNTYDENAPTILHRVEYSSGTQYITGNIQASGDWGAIHIGGTGKATIDANNVYAVESANRYAMAVFADGTAEVIIKGGDFRQQVVNSSDQYDLIYVMDNATVVIEGGTFKSVTPDWTISCVPGANTMTIVKGGSFYKFDPSNAPNCSDVIVPDGYKVEQDGDWYRVVSE